MNFYILGIGLGNKLNYLWIIIVSFLFYFPPVAVADLFVVSVAGNGSNNIFSGDGGPATMASFNSLKGVWGDSLGNLYLTERESFRVRKIYFGTNEIDTIIGSGQLGTAPDFGDALSVSLNRVYGITGNLDGSKLYVTGENYIWEYDSDTLSIDNVVESSDFGSLAGIHFSSDQFIYVADLNRSQIFTVDLQTMEVESFAGNGSSFFGGDGGLATEAALNVPLGVWSASDNSVYIADSSNHRVRLVDPNGIITTFAGTGSPGNLFGNGLPVSVANLEFPAAVTGDTIGNIYVALADGCRVVKVLFGLVTSILGVGGLCEPSPISVVSSSGSPTTGGYGLWVNSAGDIYFAESSG